MPGRALGIVRVKHSNDAPFAGARAGDVDLFRRARELVLIKDRADRHALRDEIAFVEPAAGETLDLREEVLLRETVLVAEARIEQVFGEVEADLRRPQPLQHLGGNGHAGADDSLHDDRGGPDVGRGDFEPAVLGEDGFELLGRQVSAIAADAREDDLQRRALLDRVDARDRFRRGGLGDLRRGGEVERDAHDVGVLDIEKAGLGVEIIGLAAQAAPDDLLAQKLGAERADAQDVGDGVGVPAFGQHRYGHHAANLLAEAAGTANRVHHLAQQCRFARFALRGAGALAGRELALELLDLWACGFAESLVERVAGLDCQSARKRPPGSACKRDPLVDNGSRR